MRLSVCMSHCTALCTVQRYRGVRGVHVRVLLCTHACELGKMRILVETVAPIGPTADGPCTEQMHTTQLYVRTWICAQSLKKCSNNMKRSHACIDDLKQICTLWMQNYSTLVYGNHSTDVYFFTVIWHTHTHAYTCIHMHTEACRRLRIKQFKDVYQCTRTHTQGRVFLNRVK